MSFQSQPLILGQGSLRFECIHDWLTPPPGMAFGDTHGLAQDSQGRIYVAHTVHPSSQSRDAVAVYDVTGKFLRSFGPEFAGGAHGLDLRREGDQEFLYHCDTARKVVVKTDLNGKTLWSIGVPEASGKYSGGAPFVPTNVAFAPDGGFYVADGYGSSWIHRYDKNANYLSTFGGKGADAGQTNCPHGLWLDGRSGEPELLVADRSNRRIQRFTVEGQHKGFVKEGMRLPCHFSIRDGHLLVPDLESVVTVLDEKNQAAVHLGDGRPSGLRDKPRGEFLPGKFIHPHDAIWLRNGDILVAEWVPIGRVTLLRKVSA